MSVRPLLKTGKGKYHLASWIISNFPDNYTQLEYLEPYVQSGGVFLNKNTSCEETINDTDSGLILIYKTLRDDAQDFFKKIKRIKYNFNTFQKALKHKESQDYVENAIHEFIARKMSKSCKKQVFADDEHSWDSIVEELPIIIEKFKDIHILNKPAFETIYAYNDANVFTYVDPPLVADSIYVAENEMSQVDHIKLFELLNQFNGKVMISGTPSVLYRRLYNTESGWRCIKKKTEVKTTLDCLWVNY
jgi:DNA adenine methylase